MKTNTPHQGDERPERRNPSERKQSGFGGSGQEGQRPKRKRIQKPDPVPVSKGGKMYQPTYAEKDKLEIRLNRYIANSGICSRRDADKLIESGIISVNGKVVTEMGVKVKPGDVIKYGEVQLRNERKVYLLLNKPKDYITTIDDPQHRKTVMSLVEKACRERIYPVGRLDRNSTGLLLFTNDGDMAKKLTHPKHRIQKIYHVRLDKALSRADMVRISEGIDLDDGVIKVDEIDYAGKDNDRKEIGIEIHSGRNRIVRRIFDKLDYKVVKLDRVVFAGLTKKDLPRGKYRFLSQEEVNILKRV